MINSSFGDIRTKIIERLELAEDSIKIAMAWLTNIVLYQVILNKAAGGLKIELVISDSESNFRPESSLSFEALERKGAKVSVAITSDRKFMHHKFVIIDEKEVITGSYNWSNSAHTNHENILIIQDTKLANDYSLQFKRLQSELFSQPLINFRQSYGLQSAFASQAEDEELFKLSKTFNQSVENAMIEADALHVGLHMGIVTDMIKRYTAVGAAKKLSNDAPQSGFLKLVAENRYDLTFEYLTAQSRFKELFDKKTIESAKYKLKPYIGNKVESL